MEVVSEEKASCRLMSFAAFLTSTTAILLVTGVMVGCGGGSDDGGSEPASPASPSTYSIGGSVSGLAAGAHVVLLNNGGDATTVTINGGYSFATRLAQNASYSVTVGTHPAGQTCSVINGSGAGLTANITNIQVICSARTHTIGGTVSGLALNTQLTLLNNSSDALIVNANGAFSFSTPVPHNGSYAVTVGTQPVGQTCTVNNGTGSGVTTNITNIQLVCSNLTYTIGGTVSGLTSGKQVTLLNNGGDPLIIPSNGSFTFSTPVAHGGTYTVTVGTQPVGQTCTVTNNTGVAVTVHITNVQVLCSTHAYTIGGTVSGLTTGKQVTLLNNGGDPLTVTANGNFTFATSVAHNGGYAVTVGTQPNGQSCTVSNGAGSNVTSNISIVTVDCTTVCTTTLTGILTANTTYPAANAPYCISGSLQIPAGITALFDAGSSISGGTVTVQGALEINGTATGIVNLTNVAIVPAGLSSSRHSISIAYANVLGGTIYAPTGNAIYGSISLTDSTIRNLQSYMYLWYPLGSNTIARNTFIGSGGISYGINFMDPLVASLSITNNHFEIWAGDYAIQNWAQYGAGSALIRHNTFATSSRVAVRLPAGYTDTAINAAENYWGTLDTATIQSMIYDKADDITTAGFINFIPVLSAPAPGTPVP